MEISIIKITMFRLMPLKYITRGGKTLDKLLDLVYPIGSVYISVASTNPASLFGGTWEQITNRFLLAAGSSYSAGSTGGAATVALTTAQMPAHTHTGNTEHGYTDFLRMVMGTMVDRSVGNHIGSSGNGAVRDLTNTGEFPGSYHYHSFTTNSTGSGQAHNNMPPYLAVYVWKRTA